MTPREVVLWMEATAWRAEQEQQRMLSLAWYVAALQRAKTLPPLRRLLRPRQAAKQVPIGERRKEFAELKKAYESHRVRRSTDPH
jgi:hypothetical protein